MSATDGEQRRRLLRWERPLRRWPLSALIFQGLLVVGMGSILILGYRLLPDLNNLTDDYRWAAEGVLIGAGALLFAVVGTMVAVAAWVNANEKPDLILEPSYVGGRLAPYVGKQRDLTASPFEFACEIENWAFSGVLTNRGHVGARFVALRITFERCLFVDRTAIRPGWRLIPHGASRCATVEWSGGADVVVHPNGFTYSIPVLLGSLQMSPGSGALLRVDLVAEDFQTAAVLPIADPVSVAGLAAAPVTADELRRRRDLLQQLRREYILSHDGLSPALLAGTEPVPHDWLRQHLAEMGEQWDPHQSLPE